MFRIASKLSSRVSPRALVSLTSKPSPISFRSFNTGLALDKSLAVDDVVRMSEYALRQARSEKSVGSYGMGYLVLKHCLTTELTEGNDPKHENSKGIALLTMSTLFSERGDYDDAIEQLNGVQELSNSYLGIRVAAYEAQAGLHLELEQDDMASAVADKCIELVENEKTEDYEALNVRARAIKGLVELVKGDIKSAEPFFDKALRICDGTAALSYAEFQQTRQNYSMAKEIYQNVLVGATELKERGNVYLGGGNMSMEGLMMQAMCALGQLESHLGNFRNAEELLTKALTKADQIYGEKHPKLGAVLTNMALMYRRKAIEQKSSSLVVQEGLYRRVSEIFKFPPPETEPEGAAAAKPTVKRNDIVALASGGYAELLSVQENRQSEGEKMKKLSDSLWKNSRMSLDDFLGNTEASVCPVVDCRICRLL